MLPGVYFGQCDGNLFDDLNSKAFECRHFLGTVREQTDAVQVKVRQNLGADSDLALNLSFVVV